MALEQYKNREVLIQDTILRLREILSGSGVVINTSDSDVALDSTLQLILTTLQGILDIGGNDINSLVRYTKDGVIINVVEDTVTPSNNTPLPVKITSTSGDINITAGDLNVQLSASGANYDSVRIGDGTDELAINADGSINMSNVSVEETPSITEVSTSGTITAGAKSITLVMSSDFTGSIDGVTMEANDVISFKASLNNTIAALSYIVTTGSIKIFKMI